MDYRIAWYVNVLRENVIYIGLNMLKIILFLKKEH